jgi:aldose 1-epimerase
MQRLFQNKLPLVCALLGAVSFTAVHYAQSPRINAATSSALAGAKQPQAKNSSTDDSTGAIEIGGQKVVNLTRRASLPSGTPEFVSATILPGRGMNLFQIMAKLPGKGIVPIFASPSLQEAAATLNGGHDDAHGVKSFSFGGAFLVPYPNRIRGRLAADGQDIVTQWHGKTLTLPAVWKGKANPNAERHAIHGLILDRKTDELNVQKIPDGEMVTGIIHAGNFGGYWLSSTDLVISVALKAKTVEATITTKNVGDEPEPMGIGWHPYFAIPSGDRRQARLHIPSSELAEVNNYDDVFPTGKLIPVKGTKYDFTAPDGKPLGDIFMDDNFSRLTRTDGKVIVDLTDPAAHYGIHIEGLSDRINTIQVYAPPDKLFTAIEEQFNFADPFSAVWGKMDTGMVTLSPGQSVTWKVRLELFVPAH